MEEFEKEEDLTVKFRQVVERAAQALRIQPYQVSRQMFRDHLHGSEFSERSMQEMGGFTRLRETYFPYPMSPFAQEGLLEWENDQLAEFVAEIIHEVAKARKQPVEELTWNEFRRYIKWGYGTNAVGIAGDVITKAGGFNRIRDAFHTIRPTRRIVDKHRTAQHAKINRKLGSFNAEMQYMFDRVADFSRDLFKGAVAIKTPKITTKLPAQEVFNLVISDTHFGSDIKKSRTGAFDYGPVQEARRVASIVRQTVSRIRHKGKTDLVIWINGDIIENRMHSPKDGAVISEQVVRAIWLLTQMIVALAPHFVNLHVEWQTGNHDRFPNVDPGRSINEKSDSWVTVIGFSVMNALSNMQHITWGFAETPFAVRKVLKWRFLAAHGDTFMSVRNTNKAIPLDQLVHAANTFNLDSPKEDRVDAFIFGHHHTYSSTCPNGNEFIFNAPLPPPNEFAKVCGASNKTQCGQTLFVTTEESPVYYSALLRVNEKDDKDSSLDEIIKPWAGMTQGSRA